VNKSVLIEELGNVGISVLSFEFSEIGYVLELKLNPLRATGWEELEQLPIVGLELAKIRVAGAYTRKVLFIPCDSKEFKDYVIKHKRYFALGKQKALSDLEATVKKYGKRHTIICLEGYLSRTRK